MISNKDKRKLLSIDSKLNFKALVKFIENEDINVKLCALTHSLGLAADTGIYFNVEMTLEHYNTDMVYFGILHEIAHYKRIQRMGKAKVIELLSVEDFEKFAGHVIGEEIIADRYASRLFYRLNQIKYPKYMTQQLENKEVQSMYKAKILPKLFGKIQNSEEKYDKLLSEFIVSD